LVDDCIVIPCLKTDAKPLYDKEVAVDRLAGAALMRGADLFAPGVLGVPHVEVGQRVSVFIDLDATMTKGVNSVCMSIPFLFSLASCQQNELLATASTKPISGRKYFVGNGVMLQTREQIYAEQAGVAVQLDEPLYSSPALSGVLVDKLLLQNLPSMVVAHSLDPQPNDLIIDMVNDMNVFVKNCCA
jgi:hypothetical protein